MSDFIRRHLGLGLYALLYKDGYSDFICRRLLRFVRLVLRYSFVEAQVLNAYYAASLSRLNLKLDSGVLFNCGHSLSLDNRELPKEAIYRISRLSRLNLRILVILGPPVVRPIGPHTGQCGLEILETRYQKRMHKVKLAYRLGPWSDLIGHIRSKSGAPPGLTLVQTTPQPHYTYLSCLHSSIISSIITSSPAFIAI